MPEIQLILDGLNDTRRLASKLVECIELPMVIALSGTLGAGKTQLVRFAAEALGIPPEEVTSPTYVLLQMYRGNKTIYHFDFYRLQSAAEVWDLGIDEMLEQPAILFVEWAEKFPQCLPSDRLNIHLSPYEPSAGSVAEPSEATRRLATVKSSGPRSDRVVQHLKLA